MLYIHVQLVYAVLHRAAAHMYLQDYAKAKDDCKVAVEKNPGYANAYHRLGLVN